MANFNIWKLISITIVILILCLCAFFIGRRTIQAKPSETIYIKGDTVRVEVVKPEIVYEKIPVDTLDIIKECIKSGKYAYLFPVKVKDSLVYKPTSADTLAIIRDWATERQYKEAVFDEDTLGTAIVSITLRYNRIEELEASVVPVIKEVKVPAEVKKYSPFVGAGLTTMPTIAIQGGMFIEDKYGASVLYQYEWQQKQHIWGIMGIIKF